jgi:hypothetical protein
VRAEGRISRPEEPPARGSGSSVPGFSASLIWMGARWGGGRHRAGPQRERQRRQPAWLQWHAAVCGCARWAPGRQT